MAIYNCTPHVIEVFQETAFVGLEQLNATTWVADSVDPSGIVASFPSVGIARITVKTFPGEAILVNLLGDRVRTVKTFYGELEGIPSNVQDGDILIVSLPTQTAAFSKGHPLATQMCTPYKVVRLRNNTSTVLGCCGLSFQ